MPKFCTGTYKILSNAITIISEGGNEGGKGICFFRREKRPSELSDSLFTILSRYQNYLSSQPLF